MDLRRVASATAGAAVIWAAAGLAAPGAASAQTAAPPLSIQVYAGSSTPSDIGVEPWVAVFLDGQPVPFSALHPGLILDVVVDAQGKAIEILASDRTVSGVVSQVHTSGGETYLVIDGRRYEARNGSTVVAEGGSVLGPLLENANLVVDNHVTAFLGPDGRIGYVEIG